MKDMKIAKGIILTGGIASVILGIVVVAGANLISGVTSMVGLSAPIIQTIGAVMVGAGIVGIVVDK